MYRINHFLLFVLLSTTVHHVSADDKVDRPNVVIFYTDDQGTLDANCYGSKDLYTPNIDRLAKDGVRFTQAYAHTVCCPSRAMLMTGRYPQRSGVNHWTQGNMKSARGINMALSEITLAEALKKVGYKTALFGKWHLGAASTLGPTKQGFDEFVGHRGGFIDNYNHHFLHGNGFHDLYNGTTEIFHKGTYFPDFMTNKALDYIDRNKHNNFFMYVAYNIPHYPEQADKKFDKRYARLEMPRQSYAKMISTTDDRIGQVLKKLDEHDLTQRTIIIFMSDNGHSAEDGGRIRTEKHTSGLPKGHYYHAFGGGGNTGKWRGHKGNFLEGGIRVPAIISFPKALPKGIVRGQAITACDWMPTILELCNIQNTEKIHFDGASIINIIQNNAKSHHRVMHWQWHQYWAVREGYWKLIGHDRHNRFELYNLDDEQPEKINYAKQKPEIVKRLKILHDNWRAEVTPNQ